MRGLFRKHRLGLVLLAVVAGSSCWFSTTPPKPASPGSDETDPNAAVLTGNVQFFDRTDHHSRNMPGWLVQSSWYVRGAPPRLAHREIAYSDNSGVYEVRHSDPYLVAVEIQARICVVDLEGMDCCIGDTPCDRPECSSIWTAPLRIDIGPGIHERRTVIVPCDHVP